MGNYFLLIHENLLTDALFLLVSQSDEVTTMSAGVVHSADSGMAQRLETEMAPTSHLGSLAELHG